ncbi:ABC transporter permease [Spirillospora albida]|uniref:ABC transporter permease n=1 Tax=Spirillospora albida TaxID=58123 RepID=UPI00068FC6A1|nr:FtsX-like permease family protein [Spirillospora albida]
MLRFALLSVRGRRVAFAGSFTALALGVCLMGAMGSALVSATGLTSAGDTQIMLGTAGGVCGFVAVFVVASTSALAVARRRRELALLRALGATSRQVRRMLLVEGVVVGAAAAALGCGLSPVCGALLGRWLVGRGLAPASYTVGVAPWPLVLAFAAGLVISVLGVWAASRRAGRIRPVEALRDAELETRAMTAGRWAMGLGGVVSALAMTASVLDDPGGATNRKHYIPVTMLLIAGVAFLAPVLVPPVARVVAWPLRRLSGAGALVVRRNAVSAARRTASTAAPVLVTVGLAASLLGATASVDAAKRAELRAQHRADFVVTPAAGSTLDRAVVGAVMAIPGADVLARTPTTLHVPDGDALVKTSAQAVTRAPGLPVVSGDPTRLDDASIIVPEEWERAVGDRVDVRREDGVHAALTVVAVVKTGIGDGGVLVTERHGNGRPTMIDVSLRPGTGPGVLHAAVRDLGARAVATGTWLKTAETESGRHSRLGMYIVLGAALLYCAMAIANTLLMAAADRRRDQAALRLAGATRCQVLLITAAEALLVTAIGTVLAALASAVALTGVVAGLYGLTGRLTIAIPWLQVAGIVLACALTAVPAALLPARRAVRSVLA